MVSRVLKRSPYFDEKKVIFGNLKKIYYNSKLCTFKYISKAQLIFFK